MSLRANSEEGGECESAVGEVDSNSDSSHSIHVLDDHPPTRAKLTSHNDSNLGDFRTPGKNESKGNNKSGCSSNSSNSSGSGGDNNYSADCSGDGGSDDNQSSDDTSGKSKQHAMMLESSAMLAHHHHHHHHHNKHRTVNKHCNDNTSSGSSSSNDDDDDDEQRGKEKSKTTHNSNNLAGNNQRRSSDGIEQTQEQLSLLFTNAHATSASTYMTPNTSQNNRSGLIDPQIDLSLVNIVPSSSLVLPLHATATAALLQWNQANHTLEPTMESSQITACATSTPSVPMMNFNNSIPSNLTPQTMLNPSDNNNNGLPVTPWLSVEKYSHLMEVRFTINYVSLDSFCHNYFDLTMRFICLYPSGRASLFQHSRGHVPSTFTSDDSK